MTEIYARIILKKSNNLYVKCIINMIAPHAKRQFQDFWNENFIQMYGSLINIVL